MSLAPYVHLDTSLEGAAAGDVVALGEDARHHLTRVLRLRAGADLVVADGRGNEARAQLADDGVELRDEVTSVPAPLASLTVAQGLPKARKLDEVVRQVTELGVDRIVPVAATRSVQRLDGQKASRAVERWRAVVRAAAEQARRPHRPEVTDVVTARALPAQVPDGGRLLVAHVGATRSLATVLRELARDVPLTVAIGPEGGWDDDEVTALEALGGEVVGLGPSVLRTEHAAAAAVAAVAALTGRWD